MAIVFKNPPDVEKQKKRYLDVVGKHTSTHRKSSLGLFLSIFNTICIGFIVYHLDSTIFEKIIKFICRF